MEVEGSLRRWQGGVVSVRMAMQEASTRAGREKRTAGEKKKGTQGQQEGVRRLLRDRAEEILRESGETKWK